MHIYIYIYMQKQYSCIYTYIYIYIYEKQYPCIYIYIYIYAKTVWVYVFWMYSRQIDTQEGREKDKNVQEKKKETVIEIRSSKVQVT